MTTTTDTLGRFTDATRLTTAELDRHEAAVRRGAFRFRQAGRVMARANLSAADRHVDRIIRDCLDKRQDVETMRVRLLVAADVAGVLS